MGKNKFFIIPVLIVLAITFIFVSAAGCKTVREAGDDKKIVEKPENESGTEEISGIIPISPAEVYEIIKNDKDYIILDVRTQDEYHEGHLDKALLISLDDLEKVIYVLPDDKPIIVYCQGGVRSRKAAGLLVENGFSQVYDMGGILDWQDGGFPVIVEEGAISAIEFITVDEAYEIFLNNKDYLFIDVRTEVEYKNGHIKGAVSIPVEEIEERLDEIPQDRPLIVYCNGTSCDRSGNAANILKKNGFKDVSDLIGNGIFEWAEKEYPIAR